MAPLAGPLFVKTQVRRPLQEKPDKPDGLAKKEDARHSEFGQERRRFKSRDRLFPAPRPGRLGLRRQLPPRRNRRAWFGKAPAHRLSLPHAVRMPLPLEMFMKPLYLLPALAATALLLTACPDKLPSPTTPRVPSPTTPKVPEPKADPGPLNDHAAPAPRPS